MDAYFELTNNRDALKRIESLERQNRMDYQTYTWEVDPANQITLRSHQKIMWEHMNTAKRGREIALIVDDDEGFNVDGEWIDIGNKGKNWLVRWMIQQKLDVIQLNNAGTKHILDAFRAYGGADCSIVFQFI